MNISHSLSRAREHVFGQLVTAQSNSVPIQTLIYLLTYAARGFYAPFIALYLLSIGFTPTELGLLVGVSAAVRLVFTPWINAQADKRGEHRKLLGGMIGVTTAATLGVVGIAFKPWQALMYLARDTTDVPSAALMAQLSIIGRGQSVYGKVRAMGSLGWGIATISAGWFIAMGGYGVLMLLSGLLNLIVLPLLKIFPERTVERSARIETPPKRHKAFWLLMAANLCFYIGMNALIVFSWAYYKDYLGADDAAIGLIAALMGLSEIPWMLVMNRIYKRLPVRNALMLGIAGQAMFFLSLALITEGGIILFALGAARGMFYAFQNISLTLMVNQISHPVNAATNQAITWVTVPGIAAVLMGPISGWMYDQGQARLLFMFSAGIALMGSLLLVIGRDWFRQAEERRLQAEAERMAAIAVVVTE